MHSGSRRQFSRKHRSAGFTMIELLVVLGIILILLSLFLIAGKYVMNSAHGRSTSTALATASSMLGEYDAATHFQRQLPYYVGGSLQTYNAGDPTTSFWQGTETALNTSSVGTITPDAINQNGAGTYDTILNTTVLMDVLKVDPSTSKGMASLPSNTTSNKIYPTANPVPIFLLDGWGDPIVYVPAGGLNNVNVSGQVGTVRSSGFYPNSATLPAISALDRPFFASAGSDGDLSKGDDNVYSFEK